MEAELEKGKEGSFMGYLRAGEGHEQGTRVGVSLWCGWRSVREGREVKDELLETWEKLRLGHMVEGTVAEILDITFIILLFDLGGGTTFGIAWDYFQLNIWGHSW